MPLDIDFDDCHPVVSKLIGCKEGIKGCGPNDLRGTVI